MKVNEAIVAVMERVGAVDKGGYNAAQKFNFRGVDAVVNAVAPALKAEGVTVRPVDVVAEYRDSTNAKGTAVVEVRGRVTYEWVGPEGDALSTVVLSEARDFADKATAKFMSVAFRICLLQTLALPTDEADPDDDYPQVEGVPQKGVQGAVKADPDSLRVLRGAIRTDAMAKGMSDQVMAGLVSKAGVKGKVSECTDLDALQRLHDAVRAA